MREFLNKLMGFPQENFNDRHIFYNIYNIERRTTHVITEN